MSGEQVSVERVRVGGGQVPGAVGDIGRGGIRRGIKKEDATHDAGGEDLMCLTYPAVPSSTCPIPL